MPATSNAPSPPVPPDNSTLNLQGSGPMPAIANTKADPNPAPAKAGIGYNDDSSSDEEEVQLPPPADPDAPSKKHPSKGSQTVEKQNGNNKSEVEVKTDEINGVSPDASQKITTSEALLIATNGSPYMGHPNPEDPSLNGEKKEPEVQRERASKLEFKRLDEL